MTLLQSGNDARRGKGEPTRRSVPAGLDARGMVLVGNALFVGGPPGFLGDDRAKGLSEQF